MEEMWVPGRGWNLARISDRFWKVSADDADSRAPGVAPVVSPTHLVRHARICSSIGVQRRPSTTATPAAHHTKRLKLGFSPNQEAPLDFVPSTPEKQAQPQRLHDAGALPSSMAAAQSPEPSFVKMLDQVASLSGNEVAIEAGEELLGSALAHAEQAQVIQLSEQKGQIGFPGVSAAGHLLLQHLPPDHATGANVQAPQQAGSTAAVAKAGPGSNALGSLHQRLAEAWTLTMCETRVPTGPDSATTVASASGLPQWAPSRLGQSPNAETAIRLGTFSPQEHSAVGSTGRPAGQRCFIDASQYGRSEPVGTGQVGCREGSTRQLTHQLAAGWNALDGADALPGAAVSQPLEQMGHSIGISNMDHMRAQSRVRAEGCAVREVPPSPAVASLRQRLANLRKEVLDNRIPHRTPCASMLESVPAHSEG